MTTKFALSAALLLVGATAALAETNIKSVSATKTDDGGYSIVIKGENLAKPTVLRTLGGKVYIAEFDGWLRTARGKRTVGHAGVESFQYGWYSAKPPKVRFAVRLKDAAIEPSILETDGGWTIKIGGEAVATPKKAAILLDPKPVAADTKSLVPDLPYPAETHPIPRAGSVAVKEKALEISSPIIEVNGRPVNPEFWGTVGQGQTQIKGARTGLPLSSRALVSLDFVGTDIIQILKALSIQSNVNIVSAPEVSPADNPTKLTVSLAAVTLDEALGYITAISGLRFAKVDSTYIVVPRERFHEAMSSVMERMGRRTETKVVSLSSGEASKIKDATLRALPQDGQHGYYDIIVPQRNAIPGVTPPPTGEGEKKEGQNVPDSSKQQPAEKAYYLMIVGDSERIEQVGDYVTQLDAKIVDSTSFENRGRKSSSVIPVQSGETGRIKQMLDRLIAEHPRGSEFAVTESILEGATKGEAQTMALLLFGPEEDLARMEEWARALDKDICAIIGKPYETQDGGLSKEWEVVELDHVEPTMLEMDLKMRFKGLQVSLMPDAVSPGLQGKTSVSDQNSGATGAGNGGQGAAGDGGQEQATESTKEERTITGREPMRIVLRGTRAMINEAKSYIAMVDQAPAQVALELRVMELTKEDAIRIGIDWNALTSGSLSSIRFNQGLGDSPATAGTVGSDLTFNGGSGSASFLATLDQLNNGRNLIARPNALVSDGREANLFVGDTVRYIKSIQATQNGTTVETGEVNVGVTFDAAVRIGANGNVALSLNQNFSILTGFTPVPGGGELPQTSDRSTNMFVNLKSGETLAIGGLILEQDRRSVSGIPLLKDLPIIGYLFSRTNKSKAKTEIVFFLTANVVDSDSRADAANPGANANVTPDPIGDYIKTRKGPKGAKTSGQ